MKRYIKSTTNDTIKVNVVYNVELTQDSGHEVAAASYKGIEIPEGELMPAEKDAIFDSQAYRDYRSFIESVEELLTDYYELHLYYKNESKYNSFYYGFLAKNDDESLVFDFTLRFRISTHDAHRTHESQQHKKDQKEALRKLAGTKKVKAISRDVVVNSEQFETYVEAIEEIDRIVEKAVEVMTRKRK